MASPTTPLPFTPNLELSETVGAHGVVAGHVGRTHDAAHRDGLTLGVDLDILGGFHQHGPVGHDTPDTRAVSVVEITTSRLVVP